MEEVEHGAYSEGAAWAPFSYRAGALNLKEFKSLPPVPGERVVSFVDDIRVILHPTLSLDMAEIGTIVEWFQERLGDLTASRSTGKTHRRCWRIESQQKTTEEQHLVVDSIRLTIG